MTKINKNLINPNNRDDIIDIWNKYDGNAKKLNLSNEKKRSTRDGLGEPPGLFSLQKLFKTISIHEEDKE